MIGRIWTILPHQRGCVSPVFLRVLACVRGSSCKPWLYWPYSVSGVGSTLLKMGRNTSSPTTVNWKPLQMQHDLVEPWPSWQPLSQVWGGRGATPRLLLSELSFPVVLSLWRCLAAKIETERVQLEPWPPLLIVSHGIFLSLSKVLGVTGTSCKKQLW